VAVLLAAILHLPAMLQYKVWLVAVLVEQTMAEQQGLEAQLRVAMELMNLPAAQARRGLGLLAVVAANPPAQRRLAAVPVVQSAEQAQMVRMEVLDNLLMWLE